MKYFDEKIREKSMWLISKANKKINSCISMEI